MKRTPINITTNGFMDSINEGADILGNLIAVYHFLKRRAQRFLKRWAQR